MLLTMRFLISSASSSTLFVPFKFISTAIDNCSLNLTVAAEWKTMLTSDINRDLETMVP